jgi:hypothetical protein
MDVSWSDTALISYYATIDSDSAGSFQTYGHASGQAGSTTVDATQPFSVVNGEPRIQMLGTRCTIAEELDGLDYLISQA